MWFAFASCWSFDIARALMAIFLPLATISARFLHWINASFHCESGVSSKGAQGSGAWVNLSYQADCAQVYRYMHKRSHAHRTRMHQCGSHPLVWYCVFLAPKTESWGSRKQTP